MPTPVGRPNPDPARDAPASPLDPCALRLECLKLAVARAPDMGASVDVIELARKYEAYAAGPDRIIGGEPNSADKP